MQVIFQSSNLQYRLNVSRTCYGATTPAIDWSPIKAECIVSPTLTLNPHRSFLKLWPACLDSFIHNLNFNVDSNVTLCPISQLVRNSDVVGVQLCPDNTTRVSTVLVVLVESCDKGSQDLQLLSSIIVIVECFLFRGYSNVYRA